MALIPLPSHNSLPPPPTNPHPQTDPNELTAEERSKFVRLDIDPGGGAGGGAGAGQGWAGQGWAGRRQSGQAAARRGEAPGRASARVAAAQEPQAMNWLRAHLWAPARPPSLPACCPHTPPHTCAQPPSRGGACWTPTTASCAASPSARGPRRRARPAAPHSTSRWPRVRQIGGWLQRGGRGLSTRQQQRSRGEAAGACCLPARSRAPPATLRGAAGAMLTPQASPHCPPHTPPAPHPPTRPPPAPPPPPPHTHTHRRDHGHPGSDHQPARHAGAAGAHRHWQRPRGAARDGGRPGGGRRADGADEGGRRCMCVCGGRGLQLESSSLEGWPAGRLGRHGTEGRQRDLRVAAAPCPSACFPPACPSC